MGGWPISRWAARGARSVVPRAVAGAGAATPAGVAVAVASLVTRRVAGVAAAGVEPLRGREYMEAKQGQADVSHRVIVRYRASVVPTMRLYLEDGRGFEVESVINRLERDEQLELMCRELVNA